jgi:hypothetical protein
MEFLWYCLHGVNVNDRLRRTTWQMINGSFIPIPRESGAGEGPLPTEELLELQLKDMLIEQIA